MVSFEPATYVEWHTKCLVMRPLAKKFLEPFKILNFFQVLFEIFDYQWFVGTLINPFKYSNIWKTYWIQKCSDINVFVTSKKYCSKSTIKTPKEGVKSVQS